MRKLSHFPTEFPEAWASEWGEDAYGLWMAFTYKGVKQVFRWIEPGRFDMGSPTHEPERHSDEIQHSVTLSQGYWLADTTVTQALWLAVMNENPSSFTGDTRPVDSVNWHSAQTFIETLNQLKPALKLCLPSEAQWEYACRAGTQTPFSFGEQIDVTLVNFDGTAPYNHGQASEDRQTSVEVKSLPANHWGLFEMHGNVLEWCQDWYGDYPAGEVTDPPGPESGDYRVLRGGSCFRYGRLCRSASRSGHEPGHAIISFGFRLARGH